MLTPVFVCGGPGKRLWPWSRQSFPKQFSSLTGGDTLLQGAASLLSAAGCAAPVIVTANDYRFIVAQQMQDTGISPCAILLEPEPRGTAAAVLAAALTAQSANADAVLLIVAACPVLPAAAGLTTALASAAAAAASGAVIGFDDAPGLMIARADIVIAAANEADLAAIRAAVDGATSELDFIRLGVEDWSALGDIDLGEILSASETRKLGTAAVDLATWDAVWQAGTDQGNGVVTHGAAQAIDCCNSLLRSESAGLELVGLGLEGIIAVATPDAVLVADKSRADDVSQAVAALTAKGANQATIFPKDHRPWGWFESLVIGARYQVKRICVHPGASLSLQSHHHRAEHWIVVEGTAKVTVDGEVKLVSENQSVFLPLGCIHRMENPGKLPMVLIEVQIGPYVGEDDIIRYEDVYARS